jgi:hypothetical protein
MQARVEGRGKSREAATQTRVWYQKAEDTLSQRFHIRRLGAFIQLKT